MPSADVTRSLIYGVATGIPFLAAGDHGVENDDELAHAGDERNLRFLPFGDQAAIESLEHGVVRCRGPKTSHVEEIADLAASARDVAFAAPSAAVVIVRRRAQQGRGDLDADLAQFRHLRDETGGGGPGKARHALDDLGEFGKMRHRLDPGCHYNPQAWH